MKAKKENEFFVKLISKDEKEVVLNSKYLLKSEDELFQIIDFLVPMIDDKNRHQKKKYHDVLQISYYSTLEFRLAKCKMEEQKCTICLEDFIIKDFQKEVAKEFDDDILMLGCSHKYHKVCLLQLIGEKKWAKCPICSTIFGHMIGDQPDGKMAISFDKNLICQGYPKGTIIITYSFGNGSRNGKHYSGTTRIAYLPDTPQGKQILELYKQAFDRKLIFTVGRSVTTGLDNQVVWNGIHHKTNTSGGAAHFGYPDPTYFTRVKEQLAQKGVIVKKK